LLSKRFLRAFWTTNYALRGAVISLAGCFGALCLVASYWVDQSAQEARDLAAELQTLAQSKNGRVAQRVIVNGFVAEDTPQLRGEFIAYRLTEYRCPTPGKLRCSSEHVEIASKKQPFTVVTDEGDVRIVNKDYRFDDRVTEWAATNRVETPATLTKGARMIWGFTRSSPVVAIGTLEGNEPSLSVHAETIMAGPYADLVKRLNSSSQRLTSTVPYLLLTGSLLLLFAIWQGWRMARD
jgi:hypothetical protein